MRQLRSQRLPEGVLMLYAMLRREAKFRKAQLQKKKATISVAFFLFATLSVDAEKIV